MVRPLSISRDVLQALPRSPGARPAKEIAKSTKRSLNLVRAALWRLQRAGKAGIRPLTTEERRVGHFVAQHTSDYFRTCELGQPEGEAHIWIGEPR